MVVGDDDVGDWRRLSEGMPGSSIRSRPYISTKMDLLLAGQAASSPFVVTLIINIVSHHHHVPRLHQICLLLV